MVACARRDTGRSSLVLRAGGRPSPRAVQVQPVLKLFTHTDRHIISARWPGDDDLAVAVAVAVELGLHFHGLLPMT